MSVLLNDRDAMLHICFRFVQVVLVRINALVGNTYHARMHLQKEDRSAPPIDIDARPSDAINMAVRFQAPVFVSKDVAAKMAIAGPDALDPPVATHEIGGESHAEIIQSCKKECLLYQDPTVLFNLQLQVAIEQERYEDASKCVASPAKRPFGVIFADCVLFSALVVSTITADSFLSGVLLITSGLIRLHYGIMITFII
jgi:hypothetical protein